MSDPHTEAQKIPPEIARRMALALLDGLRRDNPGHVYQLVDTPETPDDDVQPMPSTRLDAGRYEVLGTTGSATITRAGEQWELTVSSQPETVYVFKTKRSALQYCQGHPEI